MTMSKRLRPIQLDIACAVARIEQVATMDYDDPLREELPEELYAFAGPVLDREQAERQAVAANGYVVGVSVMFLADRTDGVERP